MIAWKVSIDGTGCLFGTFSEAWNVYKDEQAHNRFWFRSSTILIYPYWINRQKFDNLGEFSGW